MTIVDQLINDRSAFQEIDMGNFEDDEKQYIFYDMATKKVYDVRKENDMLKLQEQPSHNLISLDQTTTKDTTAENITVNTVAVKEWWKKKRRNNQDMLLSAESGNIIELQRLLDKDGPLQDLVADVNSKGLD